MGHLKMPVHDREGFAGAIRERVRRGDATVHFGYEPGDGTHYEFVLARLDEYPRVGATYTQDRFDGRVLPGRLHWNMACDRWLLASVEFGAMTVDLSSGHYTDPTYVSEKLHSSMGRGDLALGSAIVISELLCMISEYASGVESLRATYPQVLGEVTPDAES